MPILTPQEAAVCALTCCAAVHDLRCRRIANHFNLACLLSALILHAMALPPLQALWVWGAGAAAGLLLFLPLYLLRGMAAGDVKLLAAVGAFTGHEAVVGIGVHAMLAGGAMALAVLLWRGGAVTALRNMRGLAYAYLSGTVPSRAVMPYPSIGGLPYGVAICAATLHGCLAG